MRNLTLVDHFRHNITVCLNEVDFKSGVFSGFDYDIDRESVSLELSGRVCSLRKIHDFRVIAFDVNNTQVLIGLECVGCQLDLYVLLWLHFLAVLVIESDVDSSEVVHLSECLFNSIGYLCLAD